MDTLLPRDLLNVVGLNLRNIRTPRSDLSGQLGAPLVPLGQIQDHENDNVQKPGRNRGGDVALEHGGLLGLLEQKH